MSEKVVYRYSEAFKLEVVKALELGRFSSVQAVCKRYAIGSGTTVARWLRKWILKQEYG